MDQANPSVTSLDNPRCAGAVRKKDPEDGSDRQRKDHARNGMIVPPAYCLTKTIDEDDDDEEDKTLRSSFSTSS